MREKPQDASLEGVEHVPQSPRRAPAYCNSRVTEAQSPHTKQTAPPHKSHLQAGGTLQPPHFPSRACREADSGVTAAAATAQSAQSCIPGQLHAPEGENPELRPDLPMLTSINYHRLWCKGARGNHWLITGLERCNLHSTE